MATEFQSGCEEPARLHLSDRGSQGAATDQGGEDDRRRHMAHAVAFKKFVTATTVGLEAGHESFVKKKLELRERNMRCPLSRSCRRPSGGGLARPAVEDGVRSTRSSVARAGREDSEKASNQAKDAGSAWLVRSCSVKRSCILARFQHSGWQRVATCALTRHSSRRSSPGRQITEATTWRRCAGALEMASLLGNGWRGLARR